MKVTKYLGLVALLFAVTIIGGVSGSEFLDFLFGKRKPGHGSSSSSTRDDYCSLPADPGPCRGAFEKWFWDAPAQLCNIFVYGGCAGNGNMFESWRECNNKCNKGSKPGGIIAW